VVITRGKTMKQITLAATRGFEKHNRATRKAEFLARMESLMPWAEFCALIEPHYPKAGNGRPPVGLERMLRMYCVANWFNLADEACEDALYDVPVFREFCRIDLGRERVPDATTLLNFRHLLEKHDLGAALFAKVGELLLANGMKLSGGTIVDATLIAAPPSVKNQDKSRDPEMHQTKKGNQWYFGMKLHIGADSQTGLVHSASVTAANVHDSHEVPNLLHGEETRFYGDSAYRGKQQRERLKDIAPKAKDFTNKRAYRNQPLTESDKDTNRRKSSVRSKVEHPFLTLKRLWGFAKVRYRGLAKNANRAFAMLAMLNINKWGRPLTGEVRLA
jgi:IS5 family transposase